MVKPYRALRNGKAHAESARVGAARIVHAIKGPEDGLQLALGNAGAAIADFDLRLPMAVRRRRTSR